MFVPGCENCLRSDCVPIQDGIGLARGRCTDDDRTSGQQELNCRDGTALSRAVLSKKGENLREARGDPMSKIFERNGSLPAVT